MLQTHLTAALEDIEAMVRNAAHRHNASLTVVSHLGHARPDGESGAARDAFVFTLYQSKLYASLLAADIRFAGFLPCRIAAWQEGAGVTLQIFTATEYCRMLERPELEAAAAPMDATLEGILHDVQQPAAAGAKTPQAAGSSQWGATEDQVNMRAALPQRIDYRGTKVEDEAGTGSHDAPGGD